MRALLIESASAQNNLLLLHPLSIIASVTRRSLITTPVLRLRFPAAALRDMTRLSTTNRNVT